MSSGLTDVQVFDALLKQYELIRSERSEIESRELQSTTIVLTVFLAILPLGIEFHVEEIFLLLPIILFIGHLLYLWSGLNYEAKNLAVIDVQNRMDKLRMTNAFTTENRLQNQVRKKIKSTFVIPLILLNILIMLFALYFGIAKLIAIPEYGIISFGLLLSIYIGLLISGVLLTRQKNKAVEVLQQMHSPPKQKTP